MCSPAIAWIRADPIRTTPVYRWSSAAVRRGRERDQDRRGDGEERKQFAGLAGHGGSIDACHGPDSEAQAKRGADTRTSRGRPKTAPRDVDLRLLADLGRQRDCGVVGWE